ncbi:MAG: GH92 family glycosyl hydrolase [Clostridia bacterium]|nr:GH92 family glycosyl hydrolase [Clostridia bacterium]
MRLIDYVDPSIGTTGSGKAIIGPQMPHGMCKLSPDTESLPNAGYDWRDSRIHAFSHNHLEGVGGRGGRGYIGIMPATGEMKVCEYDYSSRFSHDREEARVGYYTVDLLDYDIRAELTATEHCGFHRYTFPASDTARVMIDIGHTSGLYNRTAEGYLEITGENSIRGWGLYPPSAISKLNAPCYFYAEFSRPFDSYALYDEDPTDEEILPSPNLRLGLNPYAKIDVRGRVKPISGKIARTRRALAALYFNCAERESVEVRVGISFISMEQAAMNMRTELAGKSFDSVVERCENAWEEVLSRLTVEDRDERKKKIFYSALYRALNQPTEYTEDGRFCIASDGCDKVCQNGQGFYADMWAIWDTFRTTNPLQVLLEPDRASDICQSLVEFYKDSGWLPTCPAPARGVNNAMVGHNYTSVIVDAYSKDCCDFDAETAYKAMYRAATDTGSTNGIHPKYDELGYVPANTAVEEDFCVTETVEYIYADWCTAQLALALGKTEDYAFFMQRAQNYRKLFDAKYNLLRRRREDGSFVEAFDPMACFKHGYTESSPWEATFFVPHDPQGLINLFGSREAFIRQLDKVFELDRQNFENETSLHLPFMYIYAAKPSRTAEVLRRYVHPIFTDAKDGIYGEDDAGALSSFNIFAQLGIYPMCPGRREYVLFSPYLSGWTMKNPDGSTFRVKCEGLDDEHIYIDSATLNGKPYSLSYLTHDAIRAGGELVLRMSDRPGAFGTGDADLPHSDSAPDLRPYTPSGMVETCDVRADRYVLPLDSDGKFHISCAVYNDMDATVTHRARLMLDGEEADACEIGLAPQERRSVCFELQLKPGRAHSVCVDEAAPIRLEVCGEPSEDYITFQNIDADFYDGADALYIAAAGDQGKEHFGMIYLKMPVEGDFDAVTCIGHKDHTSPYAPCGIVVRNAIEDPITDGFKGGMYMGAMCMRGFYSYLGGDIGCDETGTHWAMGAPSFPCYVKIEKRGKHFRGLYSNDGINWSVKSSGTIPYAADAQYVGLFSRSCIHDKGLARFDGGLKITKPED